MLVYIFCMMLQVTAVAFLTIFLDFVLFMSALNKE